MANVTHNPIVVVFVGDKPKQGEKPPQVPTADQVLDAFVRHGRKGKKG